MLSIGITGGMGSGKSTVCRLFQLLGIPVYNADTEAKKLMNNDPVLKEELIKAFGSAIYEPGNVLNRTLLSELVFHNDEKLHLLNSIVHPAVFRHFDKWLLTQKKAPYILKEAALLFESGSNKKNRFNINIFCPEDIRIERAMKRDGLSKEEVQARLKNQLNEQERKALADYTIINDNTRLLIPQVLELHEGFCNY